MCSPDSSDQKGAFPEARCRFIGGKFERRVCPDEVLVVHYNPFPEAIGLKCFTHAFKSSSFLGQGRFMTTGRCYGRANASAIRILSAGRSMLPIGNIIIPWNLRLLVRVGPDR